MKNKSPLAQLLTIHCYFIFVFHIPHCLWAMLVNSYISLLAVVCMVLLPLCISLLRSRKVRISSACHRVWGRCTAQLNILWWRFWISFSIGEGKICVHFSPWNVRMHKVWKIAHHVCMYNVWKIYFTIWILLRFPHRGNSTRLLRLLRIQHPCFGFCIFVACNLIKISVYRAIVFWTVNSTLNVSIGRLCLDKWHWYVTIF